MPFVFQIITQFAEMIGITFIIATIICIVNGRQTMSFIVGSDSSTCPNANYKTIQEAVFASKYPGQVIEVCGGQ